MSTIPALTPMQQVEQKYAIQRGRDEMSRFYANQVAALTAEVARLRYAIGGIEEAVKPLGGPDRLGKYAKRQVKAVSEVLARLDAP